MDQNLIVKVDKDLEDLIEGFLENRDLDIKAIEAAIPKDDFESIDQVAHDLIGSGKTYGFDFITNYGKEIRDAAKVQDTTKIVDVLSELKSDFQRIIIQFVEEDD